MKILSFMKSLSAGTSISVRAFFPAALLPILLSFAACASRPPERPNTGGAQALLQSAATLRSATVVDIASKDTLYRFSPMQVERLKSALEKSFVSESLLLTPAPWNIALVLETGKGHAFVALHYGDVLRVNSRHPWSTLIADSTGKAPAPGIADLVLDGDDVPWISDLVQKVVENPPSNPHIIPDGPLMLDPE